MEKPLRPGHDLDEGAEVDDLLDLAQVDAADLGLLADPLDDVDGLLDHLGVGSEEHDAAIVLDVHLDARLLLDAADHLAARADDLADLLGPDPDGDEAWGIGR